MKKYLIIGNGASPHMLKWTRELVKHFEVYLISSNEVSEEVKALIPEESIFTFNIRISESGGNLQFYKMVLPVRKIIKKLKPDYINAHYITSYGLVTTLACLGLKKSYKLILTAWGSDILITPFKNKFYRSITRFALKKADLGTADSGKVAELMKELAGIKTMDFPFGLEELPEMSPEEKDPKLFFSNRTLIANSNIERVLQLFSEVTAKDEDARLIVANDGPLKADLMTMSKEMGLEEKVEFVGFISASKQEEYYRKAQFFFSILSSDALSVSLLEAMAYACIPIVSNLPDNREWIQDNINGIILSEETNGGKILGMLEKAESIFSMNRKMISEKAIFPDSIKAFYNKLSDV